MDKIPLIQFANLTSISSLVPILDKCPELENMMKERGKTTDDWDLIFSAGLIGFGIVNGYEQNISSVLREAQSTNPLLTDALDDYIKFINSNGKNNDQKELAATTSIWIVWNLLETQPNYEDHNKIVSLIGNYIDLLFT